MPHHVGLFLFTNDLRVHDNPALAKAATEVDQLICIYCHDSNQSASSFTTPSKLRPHRQRFVEQSLISLSVNLRKLGQHLVISGEPLLDIISQLITQHNIEKIYCSETTGVHEGQSWQLLCRRYPMIVFTRMASHTLFAQDELPFKLAQLPDSFSKFRKIAEQLTIKSPIAVPQHLPPSPLAAEKWVPSASTLGHKPLFQGGEQEGLAHLDRYFESNLASRYKQTRNGLDGLDYSTKFSPWLANGSLSVKRVVERLRTYEREVESNDSTYWIYVELLWREYYQWYAHRNGKQLFNFKGIKSSNPTTSFYPERFQKWCYGNTPYPIVNACMKQLNSTGYMSNRGRQLVASCLVHELGLDWRYGAAYLEQQLVDYDTGSNWGNWQYLAGVGADPRGHRRFDLTKQTYLYDPNRDFIKRWGGDKHDLELDSMDAADWPKSADLSTKGYS